MVIAEKIYADLIASGVDVLLDDRDERPGVMFADWELIGAPLRITVGERSLKEGKVELLVRRGLQSSAIAVADAASTVRTLLTTL